MRTRSLLPPAAAAVTVLALAAPRAGAAPDGVYYIRDAAKRCLTIGDALFGAHLGACSDATGWVMAHQADGSVRFALAADPGRCLAQAPYAVFPAPVRADRCGGRSLDRWRVDGPDGLPSVLTVTGSDAGSLTSRFAPNGGYVTLGGDGTAEWVVQRVG